tara:strand:- start:174 stop:1307 length:1134 start_codon:yes stop_codon:yes gene_type:complete
MRIDKIWLVDFLKEGEQHADFYLGVISVLNQISEINKAYFNKNSVCINYLSKSTQKKYLKRPKNKISLYFNSTLLILNIFLNAIIQKPRNIIFLQILPLHYVMLVFLKIFLPNINVLVCMAGELSLIGKKQLGFLNSFYKNCILFSLRFNLFKISNLKFLCLEKRVYDNLKKFFINKSNVDYIQHFIYREYKPNYINVKSSEKKSLFAASIGVHSRVKDSQKIYELDKLNQDSYSLATCGLSDGSFDYINDSNIKHFFKGNIKEKYISGDKLFKCIEENISLVLFFHTNNSGYDFVCSGLIYDLIWLKKPAICFSNSPLSKYKNYFNFPLYEVNDILEMNFKIKEILNFQEHSDLFKITNDSLREKSLVRWAKFLKS